jgi:hypothetical protein
MRAGRDPLPAAGGSSMIPRPADATSGRRCRAVASLLACLLLTVCARSPAPPVHWVKAGVDDATTERELDACRQQANAALATQEGINEDITATLGGNWQRGNTLGIETQSLNRSAAGSADQALASCMLAKGFRAG